MKLTLFYTVYWLNHKPQRNVSVYWGKEAATAQHVFWICQKQLQFTIQNLNHVMKQRKHEWEFL